VVRFSPLGDYRINHSWDLITEYFKQRNNMTRDRRRFAAGAVWDIVAGPI
jgi:hypothetical protein